METAGEMSAVTGPPDRQPERLDKRRLVKFLLGLPAYCALLMFLPAGSWDWQRGWAFILVFLVIAAVASFYADSRHLVGKLWR
jgi:hypothetical protein